MSITKDFQKRRVVAVLGEGGAPASFTVEGRMLFVNGEGTIEADKPHTEPADEDMVAKLFGDGHTAQLEIINQLTTRMATQRAELETAAATAAATARESDMALQDQLKTLRDQASAAATAAQTKLLDVARDADQLIQGLRLDLRKLGEAANAEAARLTQELAVAQAKLRTIAEADRAYDVHVKPVFAETQA